MDYANLPFLPSNAGYDFKPMTVDEILEMLEIKRTKFYKDIKGIKPLLGPTPGKRYNGEQIIVICYACSYYPAKLYRLMNWMERTGWQDYLREKYKAHKFF